MVTDNTIEGIHLHYDGQHKQYIRHNAKKYYWHIPKNLRHKGIQKDSVVLGNRRQLILVTRVFREDIEVTGKKYKPVIEVLAKKNRRPLYEKKQSE